MSLHLPSSSRRLVLAIALSTALPCLASAEAFAAGPPPSAASPEQRTQAQRRFAKGKELYGTGKFEAALIEFRHSLDEVSSPNTRLYVARCLRDLGRLAAAHAEYKHAAADAKGFDAYKKTAEVALEERSQIESRISLVDVKIANVDASSKVTVAGEEIATDRLREPIPIAPGSVEVVVQTPGHTPLTKTFDALAGQRIVLMLDASEGALRATAEPIPAPPPAAAPEKPAPPPPPRSVVVAAPEPRTSLKPYAALAGGIALAGLGTFLVAGAMANRTHSDLEAACGSSPCPRSYDNAIEKGRTEQLVANIGLAVFGGAAVTSIVLLIASPKSTETASTGSSKKSVRMLASPSFVGVGGSF